MSICNTCINEPICKHTFKQECFYYDGKQNYPEVVSVIRCKDCIEYQDWLDTKICMRLGSYYGNTKPTDYCSYGHRGN